jgi:hypothetical protein
MDNIKLDNIIHIILPKILEFLYEPVRYKIFRLKNKTIEQKFYRKNIDLRKYINYPTEKKIHSIKFPIKESFYKISFRGAGRLGCKMKYLYFRRTLNYKEITQSLMLISKMFYVQIKKLQNLKYFYNYFINDNLNYKIFMKRFYDRYPNLYNEYCHCDTRLPFPWMYKDWSCNCYHSLKCDLCFLTGTSKYNSNCGDMILCEICDNELQERQYEYWIHKHEDNYDDYDP